MIKPNEYPASIVFFSWCYDMRIKIRHLNLSSFEYKSKRTRVCEKITRIFSLHLRVFIAIEVFFSFTIQCRFHHPPSTLIATRTRFLIRPSFLPISNQTKLRQFSGKFGWIIGHMRWFREILRLIDTRCVIGAIEKKRKEDPIASLRGYLLIRRRKNSSTKRLTCARYIKNIEKSDEDRRKTHLPTLIAEAYRNLALVKRMANECRGCAHSRKVDP